MIAANHEITSLAQETAARINQPSSSTVLDLEPSASFSNPSTPESLSGCRRMHYRPLQSGIAKRKSTCDMPAATGETTALGSPEQWEWVGLSDEEGRLDRLSAVPAWSVPAGVDLDGHSLLFFYPARTRRHGSRTLQFRKIRAGAKLLTEFVTLDEAPAERILAYARQYGPLGFCQHGDPSHRLLPRAALQRSAPPRPDNLPCAKILSGGATLPAIPARCSVSRPNSPRAESMTRPWRDSTPGCSSRQRG
jgi:hypothetical protein